MSDLFYHIFIVHVYMFIVYYDGDDDRCSFFFFFGSQAKLLLDYTTPIFFHPFLNVDLIWYLLLYILSIYGNGNYIYIISYFVDVELIS